MATNFPDTSVNNPDTSAPWADGDIFDDTAESGLIYYWYDPVWKTKAEGDIAAGDLTVSSLNSGPLAGFRNLIINGNFTIQQRGAAFTAPDGEYTYDRWWMGNAAGRNVSISSDGPYQNALLITNNATENTFLRQGIEIQRGKCGPFVQNSTWTLSLWSDSTGWEGRPLGGLAFRNAGRMLDNSGQVTITDTTPFTATGETFGTMSRYSMQFNVGTTQPAGDHEMLMVAFSLPSGGHRISAVQLEPGPVATPFEHRPIGTELALCQRYYQYVESMRCPPPHAVADNLNRTLHIPRYPVMRASPTETGTSQAGVATISYNGTATRLYITGTATQANAGFDVTDYTADAEL